MRRRLAAILAADVVGYSRRMAEDEAATLETLKRQREKIFAPEIERHGGRIFKLMGDGALSEFPSAIDAVEAALAVQTALAGEEMKLRVAVHLGDVIHDGEDVYGDGVNIAARLEGLADPGGICLSGVTQETVAAAVEAAFEDAGEHRVKNIDRPIRVWRWPATGAGARVERGRPRVALAPLDVMSSDPDHAFIADGVAEELLTALAKIDSLAALPRSMTADLKARGAKALPHVAALGAAVLVEGGLRAAGGRLRLTVQITDCASGEDIWAERFDGAAADPFELQDRAVEAAVTALEVRLADGQQALLWRREAGDGRAYELFLAARAAYKEYSRAGIARARAAYEAALEISPGFMTARVGLARTHVEDAAYGWTRNKAGSLAAARAHLTKVLETDPDHALALAEVGHAHMIAGEYVEGRTVCERAVALDPNLADALHVLATLCNCLRDHETALRLLRQCLALNPGTPDFYEICRAEALIGLERFAEARIALDGIVERSPYWLTARALRAIALEALGEHDTAVAEAARILGLNGKFTVSRWRRLVAYPDRPDMDRLAGLLAAAGLPA